MKRIRSCILSVIVLAISVLSSGCQPSEGDGKVLRLMEKAEPQSLDSVATSDAYSITILNNVNEGLYYFGKDGIPELGVAAREPEIKGLNYTFILREDAKWSDGQPVTAHDFVYAWKRSLDPNVKAEYSNLILDNIAGAEEYKKDNSKGLGIKAVDDKTLVITLKRPVPYIKSLLAFSPFYPQREDMVKKHGSKYGTEADTLVYNGPFVLSTWSHNEKWIYTKNEHYWAKDGVKLDRVEVSMIKEGNSQTNLYQTDQLDMVVVEPDQVELFKDSSEMNKYFEPFTVYLAFNHKLDKYKNVKIRRAIDLALDRADLTKGIKKDGSQPTDRFVPFGLNASQEGKKFRDIYPNQLSKANIPEAKKLLEQGMKELGNKDALNMELLVDNLPSSKKDAEWVQEQLRHLGINVKITALPKKTRLDRGAKGEFDMIVHGWGADFNHPHTFLDILVTGVPNNHGEFHNQEYDMLIKQAANTKDAAKRDELLHRAEEILCSQQVGIAPLYVRAKNILLKPRVKDLIILPVAGGYSLKHAYIEQ